MFSYIKGTIEDIGAEYVVLESNGIGFMLTASTNTLSALSVSENAKLYTYLSVREDDMSLFGFGKKEELDMFKLLISVSGIGPKGAIAILSALTTDELRIAIISDDFKAISKANGVGAKTAQRVAIELKDKIHLEDVSFIAEDDSLSDVPGNDIMSEVALALTSLGYSNVEALRAIKKVENHSTMDSEQLLKQALKKII